MCNMMHTYLSVLWLSSIKISTNPDIAGKLDAGHEIADKNIPLLHNLHVEEVWERFGVEDGDNVWINGGEEREGGGDVGTENRAFVLLYSLPEECFRALEPEVVKAVGNGAQQWPAVAAGDCAER